MDVCNSSIGGVVDLEFYYDIFMFDPFKLEGWLARQVLTVLFIVCHWGQVP